MPFTHDIPREKPFSRPFAEQLAFFRAKLNLPTEKWDDILKAAHDRAFVVAGAQKADLLSDLNTAITRTIAEGKSIGWFRENFDQIVAKNGWTGWTGEGTPAGVKWRTALIYNTNLNTSYAAGRFKQLTDPALLKLRPYWKYNHNDNVTTPRPLHVAWGKKPVVLPANDPWFQAHYPPNGFGCHCFITAVRASEYQGDAAPDDGTWTQKDTRGQPHELPAGVDYGFDYTPGRSLQKELTRIVENKVTSLPEPLAQAFMRDVLPVLALIGPALGPSSTIKEIEDRLRVLRDLPQTPDVMLAIHDATAQLITARQR